MKRLILSFILVIGVLSSLFSQQNEKFIVKKINGVDYYQYTVQAGEGLFGICRKFNVTQDEVAKVNPDLVNGLRSGQELLIPVNSQNKISKPKTPTPTSPSTAIFTEHKIEKGQTLFGIARKYNVSQEDIKKLNPDVADGLKEGMVLKIPQPGQSTIITNKENTISGTTPTTSPETKYTGKRTKDRYTTHVVQPKETLYSISKQYNVEIAELLKMNPDCDKMIKTGTELKIPYSANSKSTNDTIAVTRKNEAENTGIKLNNKIRPNAEPVRIAFLLPFSLDNSKTDNASEKFIEFYSGALLAVQEAKHFGVSFEISCYDTEKSEQKISEVLQKDALKNVDLIIGPTYSNQIPLVSEFAKENRVNTVVPFSSKVYDIDSNPYLFQFNPGTDIKTDFIKGIIDKRFRYSNLIFVNLPEVTPLDEGKVLTDNLKNNLRKSGISFSEVDLTTTDLTSLTSLMKLNHENVIFFNTEKYALAQPYIQKINSLVDYQTIFYTELNWQNQDNSNLHTFAVTPFKNNPNEQKLKNYEKLFSTYYKWDVSVGLPRYDLLGYDLTSYFISQIFYYGSNFTLDKTKLQEMSGIQSYLKFVRGYKGNGFVNQQLNFIESDNDNK